MQPHHRRQGFDQPGLAQPRQPDQQRMPPAEQRRQRQLHHPLLADEPARDRTFGRGQLVFQRLNLGDQIVRIGHDIPFMGHMFC